MNIRHRWRRSTRSIDPATYPSIQPDRFIGCDAHQLHGRIDIIEGFFFFLSQINTDSVSLEFCIDLGDPVFVFSRKDSHMIPNHEWATVF